MHQSSSLVYTIHYFQINEIDIVSSRLSEKLAADLAAHLPYFSALHKIGLWGLITSEAGLVGLVEAARAIRAMERITWVYSVIGTFISSSRSSWSKTVRAKQQSLGIYASSLAKVHVLHVDYLA